MQRNHSKKIFSSWCIILLFGKLWKLVTPEGRRNSLVSETNYRITKLFPGNVLPIEMKRHKYS